MTKRAIIVGASSGIGREVSKILIAKGWKVGVAARRTEALEELKALAPDMVDTGTIDITAPDAAGKLNQLIDRLGGMDLYFHASGIGFQNRETEDSPDMKTIATNVHGFTVMVNEAFRYFKGKGEGHIAAITSIAGTKGLGPAASYSASKSYQAKYIQALEQLSYSKKLNIRFTDIRPGFVDTALLSGDFRYPMMLKPDKVAEDIVRAVENRKHLRIIDWKYRIITYLWSLIPDFLWRKFSL